MRAESIRRLLVLGVCALGVTALYLVPLDPPPAPRSDAPVRGTVPSTPPTTGSSDAGSQTIDADWSGDRQYVVPPGRGGARITGAGDDTRQTSGNSTPAERPRTTAEIPFGQPEPGDTDPPAPVSAVRLDEATEQTATLSWSRTADDVGVTTYKVWLNGYEVATTSRTSATVRWFNDDSDTQIVQVRAVDAAGNQSRRPASLLARRPVALASDVPTPPTSTAPTNPGAPAPAAPESAEDSPSPAPPSDEPTPAPTS